MQLYHPFFMLLCHASKWVSCSTKYSDNHGDSWITEPWFKRTHWTPLVQSILTTHNLLSQSWQGDPTLWCPETILLKKPCWPEFMQRVNLQIPMHWEGKQGQSWPCQLWSISHSIIIQCKMQGGYFLWKTVWVFCISSILHKFITQHTPFLCYLSLCSNQLKRKGKLGRMWRVVLLMLSAMKTKSWSTEEGRQWFSTNEENYDSCLDGTAFRERTINQQALKFHFFVSQWSNIYWLASIIIN